MTRPLLVRFVSTVGATASFYLLLSTVPEYARAAGASTGTAGLTTTALTAAVLPAVLAVLRVGAGRRQGMPSGAAQVRTTSRSA